MRNIIRDDNNFYLEINGQPLTYEDGIIPEPFTIEWETTSVNESITLPLSQGNSSVFDFYIDWGDGSPIQYINAYDSVNRIHTYSTPNTYQTKIYGKCEGWSFQEYTNSRDNVKRIISWGDHYHNNGFKYLKGGFNNCINLISIPDSPILLSFGIKKLNVGSLFSVCSSLTSIPSTLFFNMKDNDYENDFNVTFYNCSSLTSIPSGLFDNNKLVGENSFQGTFANCSSLTSIPSGLFDNNKYVTGTFGFSGTFAKCSSLTSIPSGLFDNNKYVTNFNNTFADCSSLTSIPSGLFDNNKYVIDFGSTFSNCINLEYIPELLFVNNINAESFLYTFFNCQKMILNKNIFYSDGDENIRFYNKNITFNYTFYRGSYATLEQGTAPELWNCDYGTGNLNKLHCFGGFGNNTTTLSNYNDIPSTWK